MRLGLRFGIVLAALVASVGVYAADMTLSPKANADFLAANRHKPGVIVTPTGLQYRIIQNGFGKRPSGFDQVTVYYSGHLINGKVFDSTEPGLPARFTANKLIPGWTEALGLMREGDHWELTIPANLAYGTRGAGDAIPPGQVLVFDLQLVTVEPPAKDPNDPDNNGGQ